MSTSESFEALRRSNPRSTAGFAQSVDAVRTQIAVTEAAPRQPTPRRRVGLVRLAAVGVALTVAVGVAAVTVRSPGGGPGVEDAAAVVRKAATVTAAAAERSGTAVVRITHDGEPWAGIDDSLERRRPLGVTSDFAAIGAAGPGRELSARRRDALRRRRGSLGHPRRSPANIDPGQWDDSGRVSSPRFARTSAARRLRRIRRPRERLHDDHEALETGRRSIAARSLRELVARETGFKDGEAIRVLPVRLRRPRRGRESASALLDAALTVGADGVVREIARELGERGLHRDSYTRLGSAPRLWTHRRTRATSSGSASAPSDAARTTGRARRRRRAARHRAAEGA